MNNATGRSIIFETPKKSRNELFRYARVRLGVGHLEQYVRQQLLALSAPHGVIGDG